MTSILKDKYTTLTGPYRSKPKAHTTIRWREVAEPIDYSLEMVAPRSTLRPDLNRWVYGNDNTEIMLAALDVMLESSRKYTTPGRWGITALLLNAFGCTMESQRWTGAGKFDDLQKQIRRAFTIGMLTEYDRAAKWRAKERIGMNERIWLKGPFGDDERKQQEAWNRLCDLSRQAIIPPNDCHKQPRRLRFNGIAILPHFRKNRRWTAEFSVWDHNCRHNEHESYPLDFYRDEKETVAQWWNRAADFAELLQAKKN